MTESQNIDALRNEIADLKRQLFELHHDMRFISGEIASQVKHIYEYLRILDDRSVDNLKFHNEYIANLYNMIEPIEQKLFPGVSRMRRQLQALTDKPEPGSEADRGGTNS